MSTKSESVLNVNRLILINLFLALSLEIQNDFDEELTILSKCPGSISFSPSDKQRVTANGGKTDLTVINCNLNMF